MPGKKHLRGASDKEQRQYQHIKKVRGEAVVMPVAQRRWLLAQESLGVKASTIYLIATTGCLSRSRSQIRSGCELRTSSDISLGDLKRERFMRSWIARSPKPQFPGSLNPQ